MYLEKCSAEQTETPPNPRTNIIIIEFCDVPASHYGKIISLRIATSKVADASKSPSK